MTIPVLILRVVGRPRPEPRPRFDSRHGRTYMPASADAWRARIGLAVRRGRIYDVPAGALAGPLRVDVEFLFPRPARHYASRGPRRRLRPDAPTWYDGRPDRDNLDKAVLDALTRAGLWADDAQVVDGRIVKRYARPGEPPGAIIRVEVLSHGEDGKTAPVDGPDNGTAAKGEGRPPAPAA